MTTQPLQGRRIVVTRAHDQAREFIHRLEELGATVISIPMIEIQPPQSFQPLDKALAKIQKYDWLVLTSVNGVHALRRRLEKAGIAPSALRHLRIAAIGPATAEAIESLGLKVEIVPKEYVAESVVQAVGGRVAGKQVLLVRAKVARDVIPQELQKAGADVDVVEAYQTVMPVNCPRNLQEHLADGRLAADAITFTSSSTAKNFAAALPQGASPKTILHGVEVVSIGPATSATLREIGIPQVLEARTYTLEGVKEALVARFGG